MPLVEYILLGLLGSSGALTLDGVPPTGGVTIGAAAIVQPNGGVPASSGQAGPKKQACDAGSKDAAKFAATTARRRNRGLPKNSQSYKTKHHKSHRPIKQGITFQK